jgi:hypothetical protein
MMMRLSEIQLWSVALMAAAAVLAATSSFAAPTTEALIDEALQNVSNLTRPTRVGYATFWDGNKFVQCRRMPARELRCEAAGTTMQPSLGKILTADRAKRLNALGWTVDPSFGNYVRTFPLGVPTARAAQQIAQALKEGYDANISALEFSTKWVADVPCPPRAGLSQNLAGSVNDAREMRAVVVRTCSYTAPTTPERVSSTQELIALYGAAATAEIQRLRLNITRQIFIVFEPGIGYVQCAPETSPTVIYCEAQSEESWPALAAILTPERVSRLRRMGYADPGRAPNYWKHYPVEKFTDAAIANEILTILHDVYGYVGATKLKMQTE